MPSPVLGTESPPAKSQGPQRDTEMLTNSEIRVRVTVTLSAKCCGSREREIEDWESGRDGSTEKMRGGS